MLSHPSPQSLPKAVAWHDAKARPHHLYHADPMPLS